MRIRSRIRIRLHNTSDYWIRIRKVQKHVDPVDPDPDPQHWIHCLLTQEDVLWATVSELLKFKNSGRRLVLVRPLLPQLNNNNDLSFADVVRRLTSAVQGTPRKFLTNFSSSSLS
jgi:hypothetical protein